MRISIATKIFAGFIALMLLFGGVSTYTLVRMHGIGTDLRVLNRVYLRLNETYVQLNLTMTEVHTLQNNLINLLDTMPEGRNPALVVRWIRMARNQRRKRLAQAIHLAKGGLAIHPPSRDKAFLQRLIRELGLLSDIFRATDSMYDSLFEKLGSSDRGLSPKLQVTGSGLRRREHAAFTRLRRLSSALRQRLSNVLVPAVLRAAERIERTETRAFYATMLWVTLAVILGFVLAIMSQLTLRPLRKLAQDARRVGRGEYDVKIEVSSADEVGMLGREFQQMAEALRERERRLIETERLAARTERLAALGHLAAQITHEIRNPLSSIGLNAEMIEEELLETGNATEDRLELVRRIQREVDRLAEITEEYLQFARLPRPKLILEDPVEVLAATCSLLEPECAQAGIELRFDPGRNLPKILLDENQIRQAVMNLVRNAREAMENSHGSITLRLRTIEDDMDGQQLEIAIEDDGPGISVQDIGQIFEPFYSTKEKGTGLGLAITNQIVTEHRGTILVENRPEGGARFRILLPLRPEGPNAPTTRPHSETS